MQDDTDRAANLPAIIEPETPEQALMMLDRARWALDAALDYQSVRHCRTLAVAAAAYAREANDSTLIEKATRLKLQAERRAGQMLIEAGEAGERAMPAAHGRGKQRGQVIEASPPTLADIGVSVQHSKDWQALARLPQDEFDSAMDAVAATDGRVTTASVLATAIASRPATVTRRAAEVENETADDMPNDKTKRRKSAAEAARDHRLAALADADPASRIFSMANGLRRELDTSKEPLTEREAQAMVMLGKAYQRRIEASTTEEKGP